MYRVIKENKKTGKRGRRTKLVFRKDPLEVGGLYAHTVCGLKSYWRVLEEIKFEDE
jgi:hypothetical protein